MKNIKRKKKKMKKRKAFLKQKVNTFYWCLWFHGYTHVGMKAKGKTKEKSQ